MRFKNRLGAILTKLVLLLILLPILLWTAAAPISPITDCLLAHSFLQVCPTGTGAQAVTKADVIRFLHSQPSIGHNASLLYLLTISEFKYTTLGDTNYFQGLSGSGLPPKSTPVVLLKAQGIVANSAAWVSTGRRQTFQGRASLVIILNSRTGDFFSALIEPI